MELHYPQHQLVTKIKIGKGLLFSDKVRKALEKRKAVLLCDRTVIPILGQKWADQMGVSLFPFSATEADKNRKSKDLLEDELLRSGFGRETTLIAMGGGVTTDLVGFVAATYCRGIPLILIPTTLLGMVDAAIGGKTGVNTPAGKNLIGAFYPPEEIWIDTDCLTSLPEKEWLNGMAEVIKYGLIASRPLFEQLEQGPRFTPSIIQKCCQIKKEVVEKDFKETGLRRILNFGHTIGHAIEAVEHYSISHGVAVAQGMLAEGYLSHRLGHLSKKSLDRLVELIVRFGFPRFSHRDQELIEVMKVDKKAVNQEIRVVLLKEIGETMSFHGAYCEKVPIPLLLVSIKWLKGLS